MKRYLCGVDVGGTKLSAALYETDGTCIDSRIVFHHTDKCCDGIARTIVEIVIELLEAHSLGVKDLVGIGVGIAGHINSEKGVVITSSNFKSGFNNYPLRDKLIAELPTNIIVDNDANAQAWGEYKFGAGRGYSNLIFYTISSGVGAGIIIEGKLVRGMSGTAGEIGHTIVDPYSDIICTCGNRGCVMSLSSGHYFPQFYNRYLKQGYESKIGITSNNLEEFTGRKLEEGLKAGDEISRMVMNDSANTVGLSLFNLFQVINPELFIIGGGIINIGEQYVERVEKRFLSLVQNMMYDRVKLVTSELGASAGLLGAAALILE